MRTAKLLPYLLVPLLICISIVAGATPALALETRFKEEIGAGTLRRGTLLPVAVSDATGDVYVDNSGAKQVLRFEASGQLLGSFPGEFLGPEYVAVDNSSGPSSGDLYIASAVERTVGLFDPSGAPVNFKATESYISGSRLTGTPTGPPGEELVPFNGPRGIAVDANGDVYVSDGPDVDVFKSTGEFERQLVVPGGDPSAVAVATSGVVYIIDGGVVDVLNAKGELERQLTGTPTGPSEKVVPFTEPLGIAVDNSTSPSSGDVYIAADGPFSRQAGGFENIEVDAFNATGEYQSRLTATPSGPFAYLSSIATDAEGDIYVGDDNAGVVDVFTPATVTLPDVTTGAASSVGHTTARVVGEVKPDGIDATCYVEYNGARVPCVPANIGAGGEEVPVSADLTGLSPRSTAYKYRVCAENFNKIPNCGAASSFATLPDKPTIAGVSALASSPREVSFNGVVNPETGQTTYHFAYGPTSAYGQRFPSADVPVGGGEAPLPVNGFAVGGLQPGTTYHYTLVATNAAGTIYGPDQTFTTPAGPPPAVGTGGASSVSQQAASVSGVVDPEGVPTTYEFDLGTDTSYGTRVFGSAGAGVEVEPFVASFQSLLPGTTYHYRLVASSTYGTTYGADETFTTPGFASALPGAPTALALVAIPNVAFPSESGATTTTTKKALTNAQKLAAALKGCKKDKSKSKRASCEKKARRTYGKAKK